MVVFIRSPASVQLPMFMTFHPTCLSDLVATCHRSKSDWKSGWKYDLSMVAIVGRKGLVKYLIFSPFSVEDKFYCKLVPMKWLCPPMLDRYSLWSCPQVGSWSTRLGLDDQKKSQAHFNEGRLLFFPCVCLKMEFYNFTIHFKTSWSECPVNLHIS